MAPEAVAAPHPGRKMSPLCSTSGGSETLLRIRSLAGSIIDTLESSFKKGHLHGPRGFPFGHLSWWPRLVGDRYVISSAGVKLQVRRLPVINKSRRMVGILSLGDVSNSASGDLLSECVKSVSAHH